MTRATDFLIKAFIVKPVWESAALKKLAAERGIGRKALSNAKHTLRVKAAWMRPHDNSPVNRACWYVEGFIKIDVQNSD